MSSERMTINARDDSHAPAGTSTQSGSPAVLDHVDQNEASHAIATPPETMLPLQSQANTFSNHPLDDPAAARLSQEALEQHYRNVEVVFDELQTLRESESRLKQQHTESQRRERILIRRLALKEQELQDYSNQIMEFKTSQVPGPASLRSALLDPAVNILLQKLKLELQTTRARLEDTQNELSAWKFTPDSNTGKRLMAKCRLLYQENEELGKMTSNGRLAKLEGDLALQKSFSEEVKKSQSELDDFLQELDEDVEGMQSTILFLQQELKTSKETIGILENEITSLKQCATTVEDQLEQKDPHANGYTASMSQDIHVPTLFSTTCNDHPKIMASERLRQTSAANVGKVIPGPRTLRSSSRNIANDDVCSGKVTNRNVRNGNCETIDLHDVENAIPAQIDNAMDQYESGENAEHSNTESADIKNGKITVKRSFDEESDSSEDDQGLDRAPQSDDTNMGKHKNLMKKIRRSSLFKSDNNEDNLKGVTHEFNGSSDA